MVLLTNKKFLNTNHRLSLHLYPMSFTCTFCNKNLCLQEGLKRNVTAKHNKNSTLAGMAEASEVHTFKCHPHLSGMSNLVCNYPCTEYLWALPCLPDGMFLRTPTTELPLLESFASSNNPWPPFGNRLEYNWVYYHYVILQSSAEDIQKGLDLWRAMVSRYCTDPDSCDKVHGRMLRICMTQLTQ